MNSAINNQFGWYQMGEVQARSCCTGETYAGRSDLLNRRLADIHKCHIVLVEDLVIPLFQRRTLDPERMRRVHRRKLVRDGGIPDARPGFVAPEVVGCAIGFLIHQQVMERAYPVVKSTLFPGILIDCLPLFR